MPTDRSSDDVKRIAIPTDDGLALRAESAALDAPRAAAVLCHPHPLHGGSMYATVIEALFRELPEAEIASLRFNFRGVDGSDGRHDYGVGERLDVVAAIDALDRDIGPDIPLVVVGWSFGADVALSVAHPRSSGWLAIAPPLRVVEPTAMAAGRDARPSRLLVPEHDQFNPPPAATETVSDWQATDVRTIGQTDHFLNGKLSEVVAESIEFITKAAAQD